VLGQLAVDDDSNEIPALPIDIAFREDECRIRKDHGMGTMGLLRKLALNLLKRETSVKRGIALKRLQAGWNEAYLEKGRKAGVAEE
jgi:hypothetical protein